MTLYSNFLGTKTMVILSDSAAVVPSGSTQLHAVFGVGLVGAAICRQLSAARNLQKKEFVFSWDEPGRQVSELDAIKRYLLKKNGERDDSRMGREGDRALNIVWSAGKCGFSSTEIEARLEVEAFSRVLQFVEDLGCQLEKTRVCFFLISSAGALFEGNERDEEELSPHPLRPYGQLKLQQENLATGLPEQVRKRIFRPSSVYGYIAPGSRVGLIQRLLINGVRRRPSAIFGEISTLRDYVFAEDIGRFVSLLLLSPGEDLLQYYLLASGKPSSIGEVQSCVENTIRRKIYVNFIRNRTNDRDICLSWKQCVPGWAPVDLQTGVRVVHQQWRNQGYEWLD